jgi:hypothetical protein
MYKKEFFSHKSTSKTSLPTRIHKHLAFLDVRNISVLSGKIEGSDLSKAMQLKLALAKEFYVKNFLSLSENTR